MNALAVVLAGMLVQSAPEPWSPCARGRLVAAEVERVLYEAPGSADFWVHVRVRNLTDRPVGVQLEPGWQVLYPNQWGGSATERRQTIDERRLVVSPLSEGERAALLGAWRSHRLAELPPRGSADYYRPFNGSGDGRARVDAQARTFVIVALDGQLRATDGEAVEQVLPGDAERELALRAPVRWGRVPEHARIVPVR